ncbi:hypothetical protein K501DRAFT_266740 [Backusella circina FSU 941]|nr:hypothetical protein K501DRAFT_266740 [Backusella circina FSU 941]
MNKLKTPLLSWQDYFILRRKRRYYEIGTKVAITILPVYAVLNFPGFVHDSLELDPFSTMFNLGIFGLFAGPFIGRGIFYDVYQSKTQEMDLLDKLLNEKIEKYRAPANTPTYIIRFPDYHGEKITSIETYRAWLRKQRRFKNRKYRI